MTQNDEGDMLAPMWLFDHVAACIRDGKATEEMARNVECLRGGMEAQAARIAELESERDTSARDYCNLMDRHDAHFVAWQSAKARAEAAEAEVARLREAADRLEECSRYFATAFRGKNADKLLSAIAEYRAALQRKSGE